MLLSFVEKIQVVHPFVMLQFLLLFYSLLIAFIVVTNRTLTPKPFT